MADEPILLDPDDLKVGQHVRYVDDPPGVSYFVHENILNFSRHFAKEGKLVLLEDAPTRRENVVKAEALREAADAVHYTTGQPHPMGFWLRKRANELDPPEEPTGDGAVVLDDDGVAWQRRPNDPHPWHATWGRQNTTWLGLTEHYGPVTVLRAGDAEPS